MQVDIPYDDIHSLQISLRSHANLSHYNPESSQLPSFHPSISQIDPSPHYLRCKHCQGRLLRGVKSIICVFCGKQPYHNDVPPHPIKFMDTIASRWFLHSLGLEGSEVLDLSIRENETNRGLNAARNEIRMSDLLDLEIVWPAVSEKDEANTSEMTPDQRLTTLNFDGVDLDNFFPEEQFESVSKSSVKQPEASKRSSVPGGDASERVGNVDLSLFENVQPTDTVGTAKVDESGDDFSGWDTEFQTAGSELQHAESKPSHPFVGSSSVDLSAHMDSVFGSSKGLPDEKAKENLTSVSKPDDWFQGDTWGSPNTGMSDQQFKVPTNDNNGGTVGNANDFSSMNVDWFQDNQFQITSSSTKAAEDKSTKEDDSFDMWNDFTSLSGLASSKDSSKTDVISTTPHADESIDLNFFGGSSDSQNVDIGSFPQTDFFSGPFSNQNVSAGVNVSESETSISNRVVGLDTGNGLVGTEEIQKVGYTSEGNAVSKSDDADILMSQMHDLSFMLENNLSVPQKVEQKKNDPFGSFYKE